MDFKILKKGYRIDLDRVQDTYLWSERQCQADGINEAKKLLLDTIRYDDMLLNNGSEITYLNIPVVRAKGVDIVVYNGEKKERWRVEWDISEKERILELEELCSKHEYFYISKGNYYCPDACGYTARKEFAGVYESKDAFFHAKHCREITLIPINIEEHNNMLENAISDLSSRVLLTAT
jgi:hypothetical protein